MGVEEKNQGHVHYWAVVRILIALLRQALSCYEAMKLIKPRLEDPDVERFLDGLEDRERFVRGMTYVRNAVFHVRSRRTWNHKDVKPFFEVCARREREGGSALLWQLSEVLWGFTDKCFMGVLKIGPLCQYEEMETIDRVMAAERPEMFAKMGQPGDFDPFEYRETGRKLLDERASPK